MNWTEIRAAIETYFSDQWVDEHDSARTPVQWENFVFNPLLDSPGLPKKIQPFVRMTINEIRRGRDEIIKDNPDLGQKYSGVLVIQAFTAANIGPGAVSGLIDAIDAIFKEKPITVDGETIAFSDCNITGKDNDATGAWFFCTLEFPFEHEA